MKTVLTDEVARENLKANLARLLEERGFTRYRLARVTGESDQTIKNVADGVHMPRAGLLSRLAEALGVSMDDLVHQPRSTTKPKKSQKKMQSVA